VLDHPIAHRPVLDEIAPHVRVRCIARSVIDQAKPMAHPRGAVVSFIRGDMPGVLRGLHVLAQLGMITFLDTHDGVQTVGLEGLKVRGVGTQAVFGDTALEVGGIPA